MIEETLQTETGCERELTRCGREHDVSAYIVLELFESVLNL